MPCSVGDTVYEVVNNTDACFECDYLENFCCDEYECKLKKSIYPQHARIPECEKQFLEVISHKVHLEWIILHRENFGKTVFLTKEEAEKALEEMEK